jgi:hypothetical protein
MPFYLSARCRRIWENKILETLDRRPNKKCSYVLLRSEQVMPARPEYGISL